MATKNQLETPKFSRYRSVRKARAQDTGNPIKHEVSLARGGCSVEAQEQHTVPDHEQQRNQQVTEIRVRTRSPSDIPLAELVAKGQLQDHVGETKIPRHGDCETIQQNFGQRRSSPHETKPNKERIRQDVLGTGLGESKKPGASPRSKGSLPLRNQVGHSHGVSNGVVKGENDTSDKTKILKSSLDSSSGFPPGVGGADPGVDAPLSAVNAGDRKVTVKYEKLSCSLCVTPSTTSVDVIESAGRILLGDVESSGMILLESFRQLGLERPVRQYEHIRGIMNSWARDDGNSLHIVPSPTRGKDDDLQLSNVPQAQPGDTSVYMYYSQRPGQWDKRWITLRYDGQVQVSKGKDGEWINICHLSDFDVYIPTSRQLRKVIKPPKKLCYTIKSQQKSSMFLNTGNFVHFFSTSDKILASAWYKAVQEWRSWYLVHMMGDGQQKLEGKQDNARSMSTDTGSNYKPSRGNSHSEGSLGRNTQSIGNKRLSGSQEATIQPFMRSGSDAQRTFELRDRPHRTKEAPPVSFPKKLTKQNPSSHFQGPTFVQNKSPERAQEDVFAAEGLLGRTYRELQQAQQQRETSASSSFGPLQQAPDRTTGCSVDTNQSRSQDRTQSMPTDTKGDNMLARTTSKSVRQKPLIDLTPQFQEQPQHCKIGHGITLEQIPAGGLIDIANSPEVAIAPPRAKAWRRDDNTDDTNYTPIARAATVKRGSPNRPRYLAAADTGNEGAFTGGLLAKANESSGARDRGHGVRSGNRNAKQPMMQSANNGLYAEASPT
ncbi:hypothetical protein MMC09_001207 [Bachmanniomyces sp. S44760]|nr:hypothetical protein [Bachmanniomyces sp. S44760]